MICTAYLGPEVVDMEEEKKTADPTEVQSKWYVYVDYTTEIEPRAFYVGKGNSSRVKNKRRNKHHKFVSHHLGLRREIVFETLDENQAFDYEIYLIKELDTFNPSFRLSLDDIRCNKTIGGEGISNPSSEIRKIISERTRIGMNKPGVRQRLSDAASNRVVSKQTRQKLSASSKVSRTSEVRERISKKLTGRRVSSEHLLHLTEASKKSRQDENVRKRISAGVKRSYEKSELAEQRRKSACERWENVDFRKSHSETMKLWWKKRRQEISENDEVEHV
jgi:hypothetical protein